MLQPVELAEKHPTYVMNGEMPPVVVAVAEVVVAGVVVVGVVVVGVVVVGVVVVVVVVGGT